jgi:hypothetical protein
MRCTQQWLPKRRLAESTRKRRISDALSDLGKKKIDVAANRMDAYGAAKIKV